MTIFTRFCLLLQFLIIESALAVSDIDLICKDNQIKSSPKVPKDKVLI